MPAAAISMDKYVWPSLDESPRGQDRISLNAANDLPGSAGRKMGCASRYPIATLHTCREPVPPALCATDRSRAHDGSAASQSAINIHASAASPRCAGPGCRAARRPSGHSGTYPVVSLTGSIPRATRSGRLRRRSYDGGSLGAADAPTQQSHRRSGWPTWSGELKLDLSGASAHGADDDLDIVAELGHQFQQFGFADAAKLAAGDA